MFILRIVIVISFVFAFSGAISQQKYTLSGTISDASSGENLTGTVVTVQNTSYSTGCNSYGFYSITIPEGEYNIQIRLMGYENQVVQVNLHSSQFMNFRLKSVSYELDN